MKSFSALSLLSAFVLALTALSSSHNNCNGQKLIQGIRINQRREDTATPGATASTAEESGPDVFIPRSYLRRAHSRRMDLINHRNTVLQRRGLLGALLPSPPHAPTDKSTLSAPESSLSSPPVTTDEVPPATSASLPITHPSPEGVSSPSSPETTHLTSSEPPSPSHPPITPTTTHADETPSEVLPTHSPEPPVTTDPPTPPPPVTTDPAPPTTVPVPPTTDPVPPATTVTTKAPVTTTTTTEQPTVPPTTVPPPVTSEASVPPVKTTVPPVVVPTSTRSRGPVSSNGGGHIVPTGSGHDDPSSTVSSAGVTRPSDASTSGSSSSNKTAITIGVVIGAIVVCAGIGVWVFRKWKLSPSRQFKSKIRNSSNGGSVGGMGSGRSLEDDDIEYANYTDIFRPTAHDSALPITASSMTTASASAAAVGSGQGANLARGGSGSGHSSSVSGSSPPMQHSQQQVYYDDPYGQQVARSGSQHQPHMSLSSTGTVPDYSQYRYPGTQQPMMMSGGHGYDSGVTGSILGGGGQPFGPLSGPQAHPSHTSYASSDYPANDHFLQELRE